MDSEDGPQTSGRGRHSKVVQLLAEYNLSGLGVELEQLWTAETDRQSLRELAAYSNQQLLQQRLEEAGVQILDGEVENIYRLLTDDDVRAFLAEPFRDPSPDSTRSASNDDSSILMPSHLFNNS